MNAIKGKSALFKMRFAHHWVITGGNSIAGSAKAANPKYNIKTACNTGRRWLKDPQVKQYIELLEEKIHGCKENVVSKSQQILDELDIVSFFDPRNLFEEGTEEREMLDRLGDSARAVSHIKIKRTKYKEKDALGRVEDVEIDVRCNDKMKALELYGKHHKLYTEMTEGKMDIVHPTWSIPDNGGRTESIIPEDSEKQ